MANYIIATIKPWNIKNFEKYFGKKKNFYLFSEKNDLTLEKIKKINPRYIFFPHWSWIIPEEFWSNYECVTIHETDLPFGRGGSPVQNLIIRGFNKTKISAIKIDAGGIDTGDIYLKKPTSLKGSAQEIFERVSKIVFEEIIPEMVKKELKPKPQKGKSVIFKRRSPDQSRITGEEKITEVYDLVRMLDAETYPRAFLEIGKYRIDFSKAKLTKGKIITEAEIYEKK